jgi:hypothetical protein
MIDAQYFKIMENTMGNILKVMVFIFMTVLTVQVQSQTLLDKLPKDVSTLSAEEHANLLNKIAVFSYQALLDVPQQGLFAKRLIIEEIISLRQWLETQKQPLFQLLTLQIQTVIDLSIFNEIWRENRNRLRLEVYSPFKEGSFDKPLLTKLLQLSKLPEKQLVEYALSLEGQTTNFLRQLNYPAEEYLNGVAFEKMPIGLLEGITGAMLLSPFNQLSKQNPGRNILIKTLSSIDEAREVRIAATVYLNHSQFSKIPGKIIDLDGDKFEELLEKELKKTPRMEVSSGNPLWADDVFSTVRKFTERQPSYYVISLTFLLYPFFREENNKLLPEKFLKLIHELAKGVPFKPGQWLTFKD